MGKGVNRKIKLIYERDVETRPALLQPKRVLLDDGVLERGETLHHVELLAQLGEVLEAHEARLGVQLGGRLAAGEQQLELHEVVRLALEQREPLGQVVEQHREQVARALEREQFRAHALVVERHDAVVEEREITTDRVALLLKPRPQLLLNQCDLRAQLRPPLWHVLVELLRACVQQPNLFEYTCIHV